MKAEKSCFLQYRTFKLLMQNNTWPATLEMKYNTQHEQQLYLNCWWKIHSAPVLLFLKCWLACWISSAQIRTGMSETCKLTLMHQWIYQRQFSLSSCSCSCSCSSTASSVLHLVDSSWMTSHAKQVTTLRPWASKLPTVCWLCII